MAKTTIPPSQPHFFHPISPDSVSFQEISIPKAFMMHYLAGEKREGKATLRTKRDGHEYTWIVSMKGGCLKDGWKDFTRAHDLHPGDFLVFKHQGGFIFDVLVFDSTCCEREYPPLNVAAKNDQKMQKQKSATAMAKEVEVEVEDGDPPHFTVTLRPYNFNCSSLKIPLRFSRENGFCYRFRRERGLTGFPICLKDEKGRSWKVILKYRKSSDTVYLRSGWRGFIDGNKLWEGDDCTFTLVSTELNKIVMHVSVCRSSSSV